ncbi:chromate transporter [Paenibacillus endoradicis]|uniref:chromate transporter n=1 Tax=Paenibacillus endoradicis TaxID=2972487 RepID=UPI0021596D48|nr:chromate transporter [Paenibacillus endoradicis]MCR8658822.1 chromate transporter [Paenibacillus endoradicis]
MSNQKNSKLYSQLIWSMMKTGFLGFGGGPSVVPLIRHEAVKAYSWLSDDEFGEIFVLANTLPGPIATKMAGYLGYRLKGVFGAVIAVIAHILPSSIAMIALMSVVGYFSSSLAVQGMISAVVPVVAVMLGAMAYEFAEKAVKGLGIYFGIVFFVLALLLLQVINMHPAIVIILFIVYGTMHFKLVDRWKDNKVQKGEE